MPRPTKPQTEKYIQAVGWLSVYRSNLQSTTMPTAAKPTDTLYPLFKTSIGSMFLLPLPLGASVIMIPTPLTMRSIA